MDQIATRTFGARSTTDEVHTGDQHALAGEDWGPAMLALVD